MANTYFQFKEFIIHQDQCAMKVGTDGVLLGAWSSLKGENVLDIGTGTGLLALMLAQRFCNAQITAVEINSEAYHQAKYNIKESPFHQRIDTHWCSFEDFKPPQPYDLIVCNPPYFKGHVVAASQNRTTARHQTNFSMTMLFEYAYQNLTPEGNLSLVYPYDDLKGIIHQANSIGLHLTQHTSIKGHATAHTKRCLLQFEKEAAPLIKEELIIEEKRHQYTDAFKGLVKPFYLNIH